MNATVPPSDESGAAGNLLRRIPQVEKALRFPPVEEVVGATPREEAAAALREILEATRAAIISGAISSEQVLDRMSPEGIARALEAALARRGLSSYRRVINATGVVLHTGLGRAVLPPGALESLQANAGGYNLLEVDVESGERTQREAAAGKLLRELTGAESATVVNNNAAATMLVLASVARGKEVIVSRGQLVEIGGSFRIPEILAESGARLVEVGTTNRTYVEDYRRVLGPETGLILEVHTSNYEIRGFARHTPLEELVALGREHGIPVASDLGSGCFVDVSRLGFRQEPLARAKVRTGVDAVSFSGDKLLGGPQCGVVVGRREVVRKARAHPLFRALRVDKVTLLLLEATLRAYRDPGTVFETVPTLKILTEPAASVRQRAEGCAAALRGSAKQIEIEVVDSSAQAGSGSLPAQEIASAALAVRHPSISCGQAGRLLRGGTPPVFTRVQGDRVILDFRTVLPGEEEEVRAALVRLDAEEAPHT